MFYFKVTPLVSNLKYEALMISEKTMIYVRHPESLTSIELNALSEKRNHNDKVSKI